MGQTIKYSKFHESNCMATYARDIWRKLSIAKWTSIQVCVEQPTSLQTRTMDF